MKRLDIIGHLGGDPEWRYASTGEKFAAFSVGMNGGPKENPRVDWVEVNANDKNAETIMNAFAAGTFGKGSQIWCTGRNKINVWADRTTGQPRASEVLALSIFEFLGAKKQSTPEQAATSTADTAENKNPDDTTPAMDSTAEAPTNQSENNQTNEQNSDNVPFSE